MAAAGVFSYRFLDTAQKGLLDLFAVGHQDIRDPGYRWDGRERSDGPLLLFQYTLAGAGLLELPGTVLRVEPHQGFLVRIPSDHVYRLAPEPGHWEVLFLLVRPEGAESLWRTAEAGLSPVFDLAAGSEPVLALRRLIQLAAAGQISTAQTASIITYSVLVELGRAAEQRNVPWPVAVEQAVRMLDEGWNRPWKLTEVADAVGLSPSHFHRLFRQTTGQSPLEWLTRRRMEKAVELLGDKTNTVEQVARTLGYLDTGYFIRAFREWTGTTPGNLRSSSAWAGSKIVLSKTRKLA
jgi:AraC-like DNA-binding protein